MTLLRHKHFALRRAALQRVQRIGRLALLLVRCIGCFALLLATTSAADAQQTLSFREGVDGYTGTEDLHLSIPENFTGTGHAQSQFVTDPDNRLWAWDFEDTIGEGFDIRTGSQSTRIGQADEIGLLRFRNLFGDQPGQIPPGAQIISATLHLQPMNTTVIGLPDVKPGDPANLFEVLIDWDESARWDDFGAVPGVDLGSDYSGDLVANTGPTGLALAIDVTSSLTSWSQDPSSNRGWLFMPSGSQDIISVSGSALGTVSKLTVDLDFTSSNRGEIVATLRRGDYMALLVNRVGAPSCSFQLGSTADDLVVTLDDDAPVDIHDNGTGVGRPDAKCFSAPLCTDGGTGGLCGGPADGDYVLNVWDERSGGSPTLNSWSVTLIDGVNPDETYSSSPGLVVPSRQRTSGFATTIISSESPDTSMRPMLEVSFSEAPVFSPSALSALPGSGAQNVSVRIPDGSNATADVTVTVASDDSNVVDVPGSPLLFPMGGATTQPLALSIGVAGSALLTTGNDAGLANSTLPVSVETTDIQVAPDSLFRAVNAPDETLSISIPVGANASSDVDVTVSTSDAAVADLLGSVGGALPLHFAAGAAVSQDVTLQLGAAIGAATITASDDASLLGPGASAVVTSAEAPVEYDIVIPPYIQLGNAPLGAATDQFVVAWQAIVRARDGANADRFSVEYRRVGELPWTAATLNPPVEYGSSSRQHHSATIAGLDFDEQYEYRLVHLRNEMEIATHQTVVPTRKTGSVRFTAFGNSGQAVANQFTMAQVMLDLDPDFHLLMGDNVYPNGEYEHYQSRVAGPYSEFLATRPIYYAMGNHDAFWDGGGGASGFFFVPENGPPGNVPEYDYSFDYGPVHFVGLNSGSGLGSDVFETETAPWLAADLQASSKPWKIVFTHETAITRDPNDGAPPFPGDREAVDLVRDFLFTTAVENGADLFLGGGVHSLQRYLPISKVVGEESYFEWAACAQGNGTTPVYSGTGSWFRGCAGSRCNDPLTPPLEFYEDGLGVILIDADATDLTITLIDENGAQLDEPVTISQCIAPGDCECSCGNDTLDPPEECDDGNSVSGDGCSSLCQIEDSLSLFGVPEGGFNITLVVAGNTVQVTTAASEPIHDVVARLAALVNQDIALNDLGVSAFSQGDTLVTGGAIEMIDIQDPGVMVPAPASLLLQATSLATLGLLARRRRSRRPAAKRER